MFFEWKEASHHRKYNQTPRQYLQQYHVTHAVAVSCGNELVGIAFVCIVDDVVYFENFSYKPECKKYSAGFITYELMLEKLIENKCRVLLTGGDNYEYKRHFNAVVNVAYTGYIYRPEIIERINGFFEANKIKNSCVWSGKYLSQF